MNALWAVECWRGVAALLVVWTHWATTLGWHGGIASFAFTGVDIFFVISGFVFAPQLLGVRPVHVPAYALRRAMRIYPAYLAALCLYAFLAWHGGRPLLYLPEHVLMAHVQSREMAFYYSAPFWSLPSEVQFYVLVPLVAALSHALGQRVWPCLLACAVVLRLALLAPADGATQNLAYLLLHHLPGLLVEFLLGVWAWQRQDQPWGAQRRWRWTACGVAGWLASAWLYVQLERLPGGSGWFNGQLALVAAASFACVLAATAHCPKPKGWPGAAGQWAGRLSYGLYLLHPAWTWLPEWTTVRYGAWAALGAGCLALFASALALHLLVEEPARRWGRGMAGRWERGAAVSL
jgi:peptidoglycan/LPS O-acetylase OafA/YrhL